MTKEPAEPAKEMDLAEAEAMIAKVDEELAKRAAEAKELKEKREAIAKSVALRKRVAEAAAASEAAAAAGEKREARRLALTRDLLEAEEARLAAVALFEEHMRAAVHHLNSVFVAVEDVRRHCHELLRFAGIDRMQLHGISEQEVESRMAGRISALMSAGLGANRRFRFGAIQWAGGSLYQQPGWRDQEEQTFAVGIAQVIETARGD